MATIMPPMRAHVVIGILLGLAMVAGCERYDPLSGLSEPELAAVDRITRDPFVRLWRTDRDADGNLIVWTRQGDGTARYRVITPVEVGQESEIVLLDRHPSFRSY